MSNNSKTLMNSRLRNVDLNKINDATILLNEACLILQGMVDQEKHLDKAWVMIIYAMARLERVIDARI